MDIFAFRAHVARGHLPDRPVIIFANGILQCSSGSALSQWYLLKSKGPPEAQFIATGQRYTPVQDGYYRVAVPHDVGWRVSKACHYAKK
ncbi:MAG: hypothetical protein JSS76_06390 [Bacteroidetes bacterium]|nr:hypothetical protein [Bacteroidota bacterium]